MKPTRRAARRRGRPLEWLERHQFLVLGIAALLLLSGLLARDFMRETPPALVLQDLHSGESDLMIHVAGAVEAPGVYQLTAGSRLQDAVVAAGGAVEGADLDAVNLARHLRDGERIEVPVVSAEVAAAVATLAPGATLDINTATMEELDQLPGIGEAYSRRIVDSRVVDGPYATVDDLVTRDVIPSSTFEEVRDRLTVNAP